MMPLKIKVIFYNLILFLIIFDLIYLIVWLFSIEMNPVKGIVVAALSALLMPWARFRNQTTGRKVAIRSYAVDLFRKYRRQ